MDRILRAARTTGSLNLSGRSLREVPNEVYKSLDAVGEDEKWWEAVELQKLILAHNNLEVVKEDLKILTFLSVLNISHNKLSCLPAAIGELAMLKSLDVSYNSITSIPEEIGSATSLVKFDCSSNLLKELPCSIGGCKDLSDLKDKLIIITARGDWGTFSFRDVGSSLKSGKMTTLRKLLLTGNPLRTLRSTLVSGPTPALLKYLRSRLSSDKEASGSSTTPMKEDLVAAASRLSLMSKELSLCGLGLSSVPAAVWEADEIVKVDLSMNAIEELPNELSSCSSLQELILSGNKIKEWPGAVLAFLSNLSCLKIDNNPLKQIPSNGFEALSKLQILDLSGNALSYPEPPAFSSLHHLQELYLRRMQLREVPPDLLGLHQLRILDLSQNLLVSVPKEFKDFTSLTELVLSDNNIAALPAELGLLEGSLQVLKLDGNPLRSIRRPILDRGTKAILKYLKDKLPEQ